MVQWKSRRKASGSFWPNWWSAFGGARARDGCRSSTPTGENFAGSTTTSTFVSSGAWSVRVLIVCLALTWVVSCSPLAKGPPQPEKNSPPAEVVSRGSIPPFSWPLGGGGKPRVVCPFGTRSVPPWGNREPHAGIDLAAKRGTKIRASAPGRVAYVGERPLFGLVVIVDHGDRWHSVYANLERIQVSVGERVDTRAVLGILGSDCDTGDGECFHFEIRHRGEAVDPEACVAR